MPKGRIPTVIIIPKRFMYDNYSQNMCGNSCYGGQCGGQMECSEKDKLTFLEYKEKMLKTKLEFIRKAIESLKSKKVSSKK